MLLNIKTSLQSLKELVEVAVMCIINESCFRYDLDTRERECSY